MKNRAALAVVCFETSFVTAAGKWGSRPRLRILRQYPRPGCELQWLWVRLAPQSPNKHPRDGLRTFLRADNWNLCEQPRCFAWHLGNFMRRKSPKIVSLESEIEFCANTDFLPHTVRSGWEQSCGCFYPNINFVTDHKFWIHVWSKSLWVNTICGYVWRNLKKHKAYNILVELPNGGKACWVSAVCR